MSPEQQSISIALGQHLKHIGLHEIFYNENVTNILLNSDGKLWIEEFGREPYIHSQIKASDSEILIRYVASFHKVTLTEFQPIVEGLFPLLEARFAGTIPPITKQTSFAIRKRATRVFTLNDYLDSDTITKGQYDYINKAVYDRKNIFIAGGTGSGKTTLTNAVIDTIVKATPFHRLLIIEDTNEIQCSADNHETLTTSEHASYNQLLRLTLRYYPTRIIVGEVRGGEALQLLKLWNTGHPGGISTIHADSAELALDRLEQCIQEVLPTVNKKIIAEGVDVILFVAKTSSGRKVTEIIEVTGLDSNNNYIINYVK